MGEVIACPHCYEENITVPSPSIRFNCPTCKLELCTPKFMTDKIVACPSCHHSVPVNSQIENTQKSDSARCIGCCHPLDSDAVFCVNCGVNQSSGMKVQTKLALRDPGPTLSLPEINPILSRYQKPSKPNYTWLYKLTLILKSLTILAIITGAAIVIYFKLAVISNAGKTAYDKWSQRDTPPPPTPPPNSPLAKKWSASRTNDLTSTTNQETHANAMGSLAWGIPRENLKEILSKQGKNQLSETPTAIVYNKTILCERDCITAYRFITNELTGVDIAFALPNRRDLIYFTDAQNYLPEYERIRGILKIKYGNYFEETKDIDVGLALPAWEAKVKKARENVAFEHKNAADLNGKLSNERSLKEANDLDWCRRNNISPNDVWKRYGSNQQHQRTRQDFANTQRKTRERQQELIDDENEKLTKLLSKRPISGWSYYMSRFNANDCVIFLKCIRSEAGVRIVLSYRAIDSQSAKTPFDDV